LRPTPFRRLFLASTIVLGVGVLAVPAEAAVSIINDPKGDVVTDDEAGTPIDVPRADVIGANARYRWDELYFSLAVGEGVDPRTDPSWADGASVAGWVLDTNGDGSADYAVTYVVGPNGLAGGVADLATPDEIRCPAKWVGYSHPGVYTLMLDPACVGSPVSFTWGAVLIYDTDPADENAPVVVDVAPDSEDLGGPVLRDPGHWMVGSDGGIFAYNAPFLGSTGAIRLNKPIVGMAADPDGRGYWFVASDGGIFAYDAPFLGSTGDIKLNKPIVGMAPTPSGKGYWMVATDGGIFTFGDAEFLGSTGDIKLNQPIVGMAPTRSGHGYWLVASDGGIFTFGDAGFHGSKGATSLNQPIVGMAASRTGEGYWFVARDGGVFSFGDATFYGSTTGISSPVVGMTVARDGKGYTIARANGLVTYRGSAIPDPVPGLTGPLPGSVSGPLNHPIVGIAGTV
jgi:hypothetical protein